VIFGPRGSEALTRARPRATTRKKDKKRLLRLVIVHRFPTAPNMVGESWFKDKEEFRSSIRGGQLALSMDSGLISGNLHLDNTLNLAA
jgi:hypothetical protein